MCRRPTTPARWRTRPLCWPANSARRSSRGRPTGCARRCIRRAIFTALHYPRGFSLHPLNYALGLAAAAEAAGARIFEDTPVLEIDPAGVRKRVVTQPFARPRRACGARRQRASGGARAAIRRARCCRSSRTVIVTAPLGDELRDAIRYPGAVSDDPSARPSPSRRGRRPPDVVRPQLGLARQAAAPCQRAAAPDPAHLSGAPRRQVGVRLDRGDRPHRAWHAADRRDHAGSVAVGRFRRSRPQHHGDGRRDVARAIVEGDTRPGRCSRRSRWSGPAARSAAPRSRFPSWSRRPREMIDGMLARRRDAKAPAGGRRPKMRSAAAASPRGARRNRRRSRRSRRTLAATDG